MKKQIKNGEKCVLYDRDCIGCGECEFCDLDPLKICDNCGKCLQMEDYATFKIDSVNGVSISDLHHSHSDCDCHGDDCDCLGGDCDCDHEHRHDDDCDCGHTHHRHLHEDCN